MSVLIDILWNIDFLLIKKFINFIIVVLVETQKSVWLYIKSYLIFIVYEIYKLNPFPARLGKELCTLISKNFLTLMYCISLRIIIKVFNIY